MLDKIKAIVKIIFSDNYLIFTWKDAPERVDYMSAAYFSWFGKKYDSYFFQHILKIINSIIEKNE